MSRWYPLRFQPLFRRYLWGGRRLESVLNKPIGTGEDYAESWEIVDHGDDQTIIAAGEFKGKTLGEIVRDHGEPLFGKHHPQKQFPLLFKFLDANQDLSVQVHPNDEQGSKQSPPDLGKTEAWVIMHADPGSCVYAGMKAGVDRSTLQKQIDNGTTEACLHRFEPLTGDCIFIPAGTVHALGAGLVVAEIQQSSDTTFRLFDWNRVGADGNPRQLHIEEGLNVIDYQRGPVNAVQPQPTPADHIQRLVECDKFVLDRWTFDEAHLIGGENRCHILAVLEGSAMLANDPLGRPIEKGHTALIPAAAGSVEIVANAKTILLDAYLPDA
ncbi:MAG: mannose-6-phosphate isomerase [Pirellulaceae bacterium]|jgi:mannose-6-phosphate isomerase